MPTVITNTFEYPYTNTPPILYQIDSMPSPISGNLDKDKKSNDYYVIENTNPVIENTPPNALEQMILLPDSTMNESGESSIIEQYSADYTLPKLSNRITEDHYPKYTGYSSQAPSSMDKSLVVAYTSALSIIGLYMLFRFTQSSNY